MRRFAVRPAALLGAVLPFAGHAVEINGKTIPKDHFHVVIVLGDSNAQMGSGGASGEVAVAPNLWALDARDRNKPPVWIPATLNACATPGAPEQFKGSAGLGFPVIKHLAQAFPGHHFAYVNAALSTCNNLTHFDQWFPGFEPFLPHVTVAAAVVDFGYRGFGDDGQVDAYIARLREVVKVPDLPILLCAGRFNATDPRYDMRWDSRVAPGRSGAGTVLGLVHQFDRMADRVPRLALVSAEGLNMGDNRHQKYWGGNEIFARRSVCKMRALGWGVPDPKPDRQAPGTPANLRVARVWPTGATVAWDPATDDLAVEGYELLLDGRKVQYWPAFAADVKHVTTVATEFPLTGLKPATSHSLVVRARDYAGNLSRTSAALRVATPVTRAPLTLPLRINLGGGQTSDWLEDREFRDGEQYGYTVSPAMKGDILGPDFSGDRLCQNLQAAIRGTYDDKDPRCALFRTFRGGNTIYEFAVPDGRYVVTWYVSTSGSPAVPYPDGQMGKYVSANTQELDATGGRLLAPLPERSLAHGVTVEGAAKR